MTGLVAVVLIFSIPIIAILADHSQKKAKVRLQAVEKELELEKLKRENYLIETEKMKYELEKMKAENATDDEQWLIK